MRKRTTAARADAYARGLRAAFTLGRMRAEAGEPESSCPYKGRSHRLSFTQGFQKGMRNKAKAIAKQGHCGLAGGV